MRTEKGKPYLVKPQCCPSFGINVSHQVISILSNSPHFHFIFKFINHNGFQFKGDYTVFAGSCTNKVGIDVMRLDMCSKVLKL